MNTCKTFSKIALLLTLLCAPTFSESHHELIKVEVGEAAPNFPIPAGLFKGDDAPKKLSEFKGKKNVLLAFYPKAFTGGCTKQLCGYRDDFAMFKSTDTEVIAISTDEQELSDKFKAEYKMPFAVLGNPDAKLVDLFNVEKSVHEGFAYAGRSVFLINKSGVVQHINLKYSVTDSKKELYEAIAKLSAAEGGDMKAASETK